MIQAARVLTQALENMEFPHPITHIYNPLDYAWEAHEKYLTRFAKAKKEIVFLGMNPGPFGMMQTAVPFGEIAFVRDWMKITSGVKRPQSEHPKRPIEGFDCKRSEVSGKRLWGLFSERYTEAEDFFTQHFVANYCPLAFLEESGRNFTPDKLPATVSRQLQRYCDAHLLSTMEILKPKWVIGVGAFARKKAETALQETDISIGQVLHPSPASPAANRGWAEQASIQLSELGLW